MPPIILLDEPFTAIDSKTVADLLSVVSAWHEDHRTVLAVLHDLDLVREYFPQTLLLAREEIAKGKTDAVLTPENLLKARVHGRGVRSAGAGLRAGGMNGFPRLVSFLTSERAHCSCMTS